MCYHCDALAVFGVSKLPLSLSESTVIMDKLFAFGVCPNDLVQL
ncbi:hypothetical protein AO382_1580 [Moraxella catarrhalis]|uniref:Uncharacterized protein n=1 Tax=Moraxella catarrhalis TaxID=480 RepID=A0A7Z0UY19_MORCA|nr:hypothetical protein AO382_1580 [Moraxella catarrhalis]